MRNKYHSGFLVLLRGAFLLAWTFSFLSLYRHQTDSQLLRRLILADRKVGFRTNTQYHALLIDDKPQERTIASIVGNQVEYSTTTWKSLCESIHHRDFSSVENCRESSNEDQSEPAIHYFGQENGPQFTSMTPNAYDAISSIRLGSRMGINPSLVKSQPNFVVLNKDSLPSQSRLSTLSQKVQQRFQSAIEMINDQAFVVWQPSKDNNTASTEIANEAALNWTYRMPNVLYVHPTTSISAVLKDHATQKPQRIFLLSGAIRTLNYTQESLLRNFIHQLCPIATCSAHVVTHFSYSDNRPIPGKASDPRGQAISSAIDSNFTLFENVKDLTVHKVPGYDIGSLQEQEAMDLYQRECSDKTLARRMHLFRQGDPRRYSMWFARAWIWRHVQNTFSFENADLIAFARPDLLWMLPVPSFQFFKDFAADPKTEVWVHDSYFASVPDTFALFRTARAANRYFDLKTLVSPGVACLGGPNFNETLVNQRLLDSGTKSSSDDWCSSRDSEKYGWSEKILSRRLASANLSVRFFPAAVTILRPPNKPVCFPLSPDTLFREVEHQESYIPAAACKAALSKLKRNETVTSILAHRPFRFRNQNDQNLCLRLDDSTRLLSLTSCQYPIPIEQLFVTSDQRPLMGYYEDYTRERMVRVRGSFPDPKEWIQESAELYGFETLIPVEKKTSESED